MDEVQEALSRGGRIITPLSTPEVLAGEIGAAPGSNIIGNPKTPHDLEEPEE